MDNAPGSSTSAFLSPQQVLEELRRVDQHRKRTARILAHPLPWKRRTEPEHQINQNPPDSSGKLLRQTALLWQETGGCCVYCGLQTLLRNWSKDHILPKSLGGPNALWNYLPACRDCNSVRGVTLPIFPLANPTWTDFVRGREARVISNLSYLKSNLLASWKESLNYEA